MLSFISRKKFMLPRRKKLLPKSGTALDNNNNNNNNNNTTMFIQGTNKPYKGMTVGPVVS